MEKTQMMEDVKVDRSQFRKGKAPEKILSMKDYILEHYGDQMMESLKVRIEQGILPFYNFRVPEEKRYPFHIFPEGCSIRSITFYRDSRYVVYGDAVFVVSAVQDIPGQETKAVALQWYRADLFINCEENMFFDYCNFRVYRHEATPQGQLLSEYLIPRFSRENIEKEVEDIMLSYLPEQWNSIRVIDEEALARRLGLDIVKLSLYNKPNVKSILFFNQGHLVTEQNESKELKLEGIPEHTIVLNTNVAAYSSCERENIFHECFHYLEHHLFFLLQNHCSSDCSEMPKWRASSKQDKNDNPLEWMEWQAKSASISLLMMRSVFLKDVVALKEKYEAYSFHEGYKMQKIACALADLYAVPRNFVKMRLIQLNYVAAKGCLNYIDGRYIAPFAFEHDSCRNSQTFVIGSQDAISEYIQNEKFREIIDHGNYVYVDGHLCLNDPKYIQKSGNELQMTSWGNTHVDQCCLRFVKNYIYRETVLYQHGQLHSDENYNGTLLSLSLNGTCGNIHNQIEEVAEKLNTLPVTFSGTLKELMRYQHITLEELEERSGISVSTLNRLRKEDRSQYSIDQVMALCIGLNLPPEFSADLLQKAGILLRNNSQHLTYRFILRTMYTDTLEHVQQSLSNCGFSPLKVS